MRQFLINWLGIFAVFVSLGLVGWGIWMAYAWLFANFNPMWPIGITILLAITTICAADLTSQMKKAIK